MESIFDKETRERLIERINLVNENNTRQWGKMNVYQMLRHCSQWEEMTLGKKKLKRSFLGRLFGKLALRSVLKDSSPLRRNTPTIPEFIVKEASGDIEAEKKKWIGMISEYGSFSNGGFVHPFFGRLTKEQIGYIAYKHADHHLRQFNA